MASSTASFATRSLSPDMEPERSSTIARLTGGRGRSVVARGATIRASRKRLLCDVGRMSRRSWRTVRVASLDTVMVDPPRGAHGRS